MALCALLAVGAMNAFHGGADLVSSLRAVRPGTSFEVAVRIHMDPGWHTYWQNPGDAGVSPTIKWSLPKGWQAGPIRWQVPHKLLAPELVSYGYENQTLLLVGLTAPKEAPLGSLASVCAKVDWLVCSVGCVPAKASLSLPIRIAAQDKPDPVWMPRLSAAIAELPPPSKSGEFSATWSGKNIVLSFDGSKERIPSDVTFYDSDSAVVEPTAPQVLGSAKGHPTLTLKLSMFAPASVPRLRGLLVSRQGSTRSTLTIDIPIRRTNL